MAIQVPDQDRLCHELQEQGIHIGNWLGFLRIDPACYNTTDELDVLLARIRQFAAG